MGAYVATKLRLACRTLWSFCKIRYPMRLLGEHLRLEKAPLRPDLHRSPLLLPSPPSKLTRKPNINRLDLSDTSSTSFVQSVRSSKRVAFKAEAPIGIFDKAPATISNISLRGHRSQSFDHLSRHINNNFKIKYCVPRAENAYLGSQKHSQSQQEAKAQKMSEGKDAMQTLECQDKQESSETSSSTQRYPCLQLFHISSMATTFVKSYTYVANHMNSVFSRHFAKVPMQDDFETTSAATTSSKEADESQVKLGAAQAQGESNPISSSWKEGYPQIARQTNKYFGVKVTDGVAEGRRRTEEHPVEKTSLHSNHLSTQSSSQTRDVPKYGGLFHSSHYATNYGGNYFQMADHVNQYFKGKSGLNEGTDRIELEPGTATSEKTVSFMDRIRLPTSTIPDILGSYLNLASLTQTGKPKPARTSSEAIFNRTFALSHMQVEEVAQGLIGSVVQASSPEALTACVEALNEHLISYPSCKAFMWQEKTAVTLLRKRKTHRENQELQRALRETLALIGYVDPVKGRGIRVLSIDGGGTRGVVPVKMLMLLEAETGKKIHQMFDYICGVSSGAILAFLLGMDHSSLEECADMYRRLSLEVFQRNRLVGTVNMGWSHSYYNTETWEAILQETLGHTLLIKTARDVSNPKVSAVSAVVNWGTTPKPFVFRNYNHKPGSFSRYAGGSGFQIWQALRASSAAPGYFQEFPLESDIHQDGGVILNNPCALAIHESRLLWPNQAFQCVLSLGTGHNHNEKRAPVTATSLRAKISSLICSATDTEGVHTLLDDLLPPDVYFRFNPPLSAMVSLDESRPQALDQLQRDTQTYLERNQPKLARLCLVLGAERSAVSRTKDWMSERAWVMRQRWV